MFYGKIMLMLLLTILLVLCNILTLGVLKPKPPKQLKAISFQEEKLALIDIDGWDGQAIRISKEFYKKILKEKVIPEDLDQEIKNRLFGTTNRLKDGIYLLQGKNHDKGKEIIYFGETSDFKRRMLEHKKNNNCDWVNYIFYFTNTKENFGLTIRRKAEIMLIRMANRNKNLIVKNTKSDSKEYFGILKYYSVLKIVENIEFILKHFGINLMDK